MNVLGGEQGRQLLELAVQGVGQGALQPVVDDPGDGGNGQRGAGGQAAGQVGHRLVELTRRDQPVDHAQALGLGRGDGPAGGQQLEGPAAADQPGQPLGAADAGQQPVGDLGEPIR